MVDVSFYVDEAGSSAGRVRLSHPGRSGRGEQGKGNSGEATRDSAQVE